MIREHEEARDGHGRAPVGGLDDLDPGMPAGVDAGDDRGDDPARRPIDARDREVFRALGRMMRNTDDLVRAVTRLGFLVEAAGLGVGMDPDLATGLRAAHRALVLMDAAHPAADLAAFKIKLRRLRSLRWLSTDNVGAMVSKAIDEDRRRACGGGRGYS